MSSFSSMRAVLQRLCWCLPLVFSTNIVRGANTNAPVVASAHCFDGQTVGICFSKVLDPVSAANPANYSIDQPGFAIAGVEFRSDQTSVVLHLSKRFPASKISITITNVFDLQGNTTLTRAIGAVNNLTPTDIGIPAVDPLTKGSEFDCEPGVFAVSAGGSGILGSADGFHFIYQPYRHPFLELVVTIASLEAANHLSSAGLMIRESLDPGSRFIACVVTPPDVPSKDGSGNGANQYFVIQRDVANGPSKIVPLQVQPPGVAYPKAEVRMFRSNQTFGAHLFLLGPGQGQSTLAEVQFSQPFPDLILVGMATTSNNNGPDHSTLAHYLDYGIRYGDLSALPQLSVVLAGTNVVLSWPDLIFDPFYVISSPRIGAGAAWWPVDAPTELVNGRNTVVVPVVGEQNFFKLDYAPR